MKLFLALALLFACAIADPVIVAKKGAYAPVGDFPSVGNDLVITLELFNVGDSCDLFLSLVF